MHTGAAGLGAQIHEDARSEASTWRELLYRYLESWAEANPTKIFAAPMLRAWNSTINCDGQWTHE